MHSSYTFHSYIEVIRASELQPIRPKHPQLKAASQVKHTTFLPPQLRGIVGKHTTIPCMNNARRRKNIPPARARARLGNRTIFSRGGSSEPIHLMHTRAFLPRNRKPRARSLARAKLPIGRFAKQGRLLSSYRQFRAARVLHSSRTLRPARSGSGASRLYIPAGATSYNRRRRHRDNSFPPFLPSSALCTPRCALSLSRGGRLVPGSGKNKLQLSRPIPRWEKRERYGFFSTPARFPFSAKTMGEKKQVRQIACASDLLQRASHLAGVFYYARAEERRASLSSGAGSSTARALSTP